MGHSAPGDRRELRTGYGTPGPDRAGARERGHREGRGDPEVRAAGGAGRGPAVRVGIRAGGRSRLTPRRSRPLPLIGRGAEERPRHWPTALHSVPRPGVRGTEGAWPGRAAPGGPPAPGAHLEGVDVHRVGERVGVEARHGRDQLLLRSRRRRSWRFRGTRVTRSRVTSRRRVRPARG